jgi:hypothetical protein
MKTREQAIADVHPAMAAKYDFTNAQYHGALERMTGIVCPEHGEFSQYPSQLRKNGSGCPACGELVRRAKKRASREEIIARATEIHGGAYTYDRAVYKNLITKFAVTCPIHGDFLTTPANHLKGRGCPKCGAERRGRRKDPVSAARKTADTKLAQHGAAFVEQARRVHGDLYDYSAVRYAGRKQPVTIICPAHGPFDQTPGHHLSRKHGCPQCSHHRSKGEAEIAAFMAVFTPLRQRDRSIVPPKELDIYAPSARFAVEYCGEYWHAARAPEDEAFARRRHVEKQKACQAIGVDLLTVFESEWLARPQAIKRIIRNRLGVFRGSLMARKCQLDTVSGEEARVFFEAYHPQGGGGWGVHYGLRYRGKLVACMRFTHGANDRGVGAERVWTLTRYATRLPVAGGASRLFSAFLSEHEPPLVKSFSDNRFFSGAMYEKLGFAFDGDVEPDYQVYHPKTGLLPKTAWQRKKIPDRIRDLGFAEVFDPERDPRSEREMTFLLGAARLYDCGKRRWLWRKSP